VILTSPLAVIQELHVLPLHLSFQGRERGQGAMTVRSSGRGTQASGRITTVITAVTSDL
jgi:hypothetical protein